MVFTIIPSLTTVSFTQQRLCAEIAEAALTRALKYKSHGSPLDSSIRFREGMENGRGPVMRK